VFPTPSNLMLILFSLSEIAWARFGTTVPRELATDPAIVPVSLGQPPPKAFKWCGCGLLSYRRSM